jgi:mono/diheme cytochrome c family protein
MTHEFIRMTSAWRRDQGQKLTLGRQSILAASVLGLVAYVAYGVSQLTPVVMAPAPRWAGTETADGVGAAVPPAWLSETGLYLAADSAAVDPRNLAYLPQYPLWSDGASKRRWVSLPEGTAIDTSDPDRWRFPVGTRFWKEFSFGVRVETRYMERLRDGTFMYASYVWDAAGTDAELAPERGVSLVRPDGNGERYAVPSRADCPACHEGRVGAVLGFGALQLSDDRDPLAPRQEPPEGAVYLAELARRGLLQPLPTAWSEPPPRIVARTAGERAALGYLFGNCAGCHNPDGPLGRLGLDLDLDISVLLANGPPGAQTSAVGRPSQSRLPGAPSALRIAAGHPAESTVVARMRSRNPTARMPPVGTRLLDIDGVTLIERWIESDL